MGDRIENVSQTGSASNPNGNLAQYMDLFVSEAQDHLQEMNRALLAIEDAERSGQEEAASQVEVEQIAGLFRAAHTLKGMAASLGLQQIAVLSHRMEDALDLLRHKQCDFTQPMLDALFACLDRLDGLVNAVAAGDLQPGDVSHEMALLEEALRAAPEVPKTDPEPVQSSTGGEPAWEAHIKIAPDCQFKGPRAFVILRRLSQLAEVLSCQPSEGQLLAGGYTDGFKARFGSDVDPQALEGAAGRLSEVVSICVDPLQSAAHEPAPEGEGAEDQIPAEPASQATVYNESEPTAAGTPPVITAPVAREPKPISSPPHATATAGEAAATMVRLKVSLLDQLLEAAADMVVNHSLLAQIARKHDLPELKDGLETHAAAIKNLEQVVLSMRMVPVAQVFNRFPRLVRDLSKDLGKEVHFEMAGVEIELDRMILDRLVDPLVHLLRNAVDHGVESAAERTRAGKPRPATIRLAARREQKKVLIEVSDDGRGLSPEAILKTALERGLVNQRQASNMDEHAILDLICLPGFSTKKQISGVSGRGVGMDVVKQTLNKVGGTLEIETEPGQGSLFRLTCPLTIAIAPALLVRSGTERYAIPLTHVLHTLQLQPSELGWVYNQPMLRWKDLLLPLFSLGEFLGVQDAAAIPHLADERVTSTPGGEDAADPADLEAVQVVVVAPGRKAYGLVVDEILGKEDIVLKPLTRYLGAIPGLSGITFYGGRDASSQSEIILVLDVAGLVQSLADNRKDGHDG